MKDEIKTKEGKVTAGSNQPKKGKKLESPLEGKPKAAEKRERKPDPPKIMHFGEMIKVAFDGMTGIDKDKYQFPYKNYRLEDIATPCEWDYPISYKGEENHIKNAQGWPEIMSKTKNFRHGKFSFQRIRISYINKILTLTFSVKEVK